MSGVLSHARGLFVETAVRPAPSAATLVVRPSVAVVCSAARAHSAAAAVALALSGACGAPFALAAGVGIGPTAPASFSLAARRAAARLRQRGERANAVGRVVWLAADSSAEEGDDAAGIAAGASVALARAAGAVSAPAVLALPFARTAAIDRVLAWHDALVVVPEPETPPSLAALVLGSLEELRRPVVAMEAPSRMAARGASAGLRAPACAVAALAQLRSVGGTP